LPQAVRAEIAFAGLQSLARYEAISGHPQLWLISLKRPARNPRAAWEKLRTLLGAKIALAPALVDEEQNIRLPTGTVIARFAQDPTDAELAAFGDELGLRVVERNKFVRKQVSFRPEKQDTFLPELVDRARRARPGLVNVWADTLSQYQRA
jgi:hypothetical protein